MKNYSKIEKQEGARIEFHDRLGLTGSEISINELPAKAAVPFVHAHKENEEVYYIVKGSGTFAIDGEEVALKEGDFRTRKRRGAGRRRRQTPQKGSQKWKISHFS